MFPLTFSGYLALGPDSARNKRGPVHIQPYTAIATIGGNPGQTEKIR